MSNHHLVELGQGVFAFISPRVGFGHTNVGLVIDEDGLTVIDTTATPQEGEAVRESILTLTRHLGLPIKRVAVTSSRVPFIGGGRSFRQSAFYASDETSEELDEPLNPLALRRLLPQFAEAYDDEFVTRPATHTITDDAWLTPAGRGWVLPGESPANLVVQVPGANVVFAGALATFGVTPLTFAGDPFAWIESLARLLELGTTIVPGHGAVGGAGDLADLSGYLQACIRAEGDPGRIGAGPWDRWSDRRFDTVNTERAARCARRDFSLPAAMLRLLGL